MTLYQLRAFKDLDVFVGETTPNGPVYLRPLYCVPPRLLDVEHLVLRAEGSVAAVAEVLTARADLRIKVCGGSDCDWLFIDRTKAGRRRWCDTRTCGNIARVRRFRMKH